MLRKTWGKASKGRTMKAAREAAGDRPADSSQRSAQLVRLQNMKIETLRLNKPPATSQRMQLSDSTETQTRKGARGAERSGILLNSCSKLAQCPHYVK